MTSATLTIGERLRAATTAAAVAACLALGAASNAHAASEPTLRVSYGDLNLTTEQGSRALYGRIVDAARAVCVADDIRDLSAVAAAHACRQQAIARAVRQVHNPMLASVYEAQLQHG
ncbi:MAG: UrcA family protein [Steroidobacteraceae bacterium]|jgi:UrcA family protein